MEITANSIQTVLYGANVLFTETPVCGCASIVHREGSGLVTLRGITNQCRARYKVTFGANVALPTGSTATSTTMAIAINGEAIPSTTMITTPGAVEEYNNIFTAIYIDVPKGCCSQVSIKNISTSPTGEGANVLVQNANMIVERVA